MTTNLPYPTHTSTHVAKSDCHTVPSNNVQAGPPLSLSSWASISKSNSSTIFSRSSAKSTPRWTTLLKHPSLLKHLHLVNFARGRQMHTNNGSLPLNDVLFQLTSDEVMSLFFRLQILRKQVIFGWLDSGIYPAREVVEKLVRWLGQPHNFCRGVCWRESANLRSAKFRN